MKWLKLTLSLLFWVPAGALAGGMTWYHEPRLDSPIWQMAIGGCIGVFFGLVFGGVRGPWLSWFYRVRTANRVARWRCRAGAAPVPRGSVSGAQGWEAAGVGEAVAGVVPAGAALGSAACQRSGSSSSRRSVGSDGKRVSTSFK